MVGELHAVPFEMGVPARLHGAEARRAPRPPGPDARRQGALGRRQAVIPMSGTWLADWPWRSWCSRCSPQPHMEPIPPSQPLPIRPRPRLGTTKEVTYRLADEGQRRGRALPRVLPPAQPGAPGGPLGCARSAIVALERRGRRAAGHHRRPHPQPAAGHVPPGLRALGRDQRQRSSSPQGADGALVGQGRDRRRLRTSPACRSASASRCRPPAAGRCPGITVVETSGPRCCPAPPAWTSGSAPGGPARPAARRRAAAFTGTTRPALRRQRIELRYSFKRKDVLTTDARGRFRPRRP